MAERLAVDIAADLREQGGPLAVEAADKLEGLIAALADAETARERLAAENERMRPVVAAVGVWRSTVRPGAMGPEHAPELMVARAYDTYRAAEAQGAESGTSRERESGSVAQGGAGGPVSVERRAAVEAATTWALLYPIPAWSLASGDGAERLARNWGEMVAARVLHAFETGEIPGPGWRADVSGEDTNRTENQP